MVKFRHICIVTIIFITLSIEVFANSIDILSAIENNIFGFDYTNDSTQNRVVRLEKTVYGKANTGNLQNRITKLSGDISADVIGLEIKPTRDTFSEEEAISEDSSVKYPIVDEIEKKLFNKTYPNRDFHTRIVTIEKKLFGKIYDVDDYSTRMDRIKAEIHQDVTENFRRNEYDNGTYYNDKMINAMDLADTEYNRFKMPFGQKKYSRPYANYGDYINKNNNIIPYNNLNDDITQMEYDMFGTEFSNEDTQSRIRRLNSVNKAKKSSKKYDSQKFSQHMSTAMEIGAMILMILAMVL